MSNLVVMQFFCSEVSSKSKRW